MRSLLLAAAALTSAAMSVQAHAQTLASAPAKVEPYPSDFDKRVHALLENDLKDSDSAKVVLLRAPRLRTETKWGAFHSHPRTVAFWVACYSVNAKNSYGAFTGKHLYMFGFKDGEMHGVDTDGKSSAGDADMECALPADPSPNK